MFGNGDIIWLAFEENLAEKHLNWQQQIVCYGILPMLYHGFISYSHAADGNLAPAVQRALHTLAKPWYRRRALRVFRDKTSLAANSALWPAIEQALGDSEWFLFMASPPAAQSHWVQKELQWWLENRSSNKILILLTDGELNWDNAQQDFDWNHTTAVPNILQGSFKDEPLYVDLRWARTQANMTIANAEFRSAALDIAAPLHGMAKDELDGEDVQQLRKNKAWAWSAASALFVLAVMATGAAVFAVNQRNEAVAQRDVAQGRQLRAEAQRLASVDSQWTTAVLVAIEASRKADDANSYEVLWKLVAAGAKPVARFTSKQDIGSRIAFSPDGQLLATGDKDAVMIFPARGGKEIQKISFPGWPRFVGFNAAGDLIAAASDDSVRIFSVANGKEIARRDDGTKGSIFAFSADGQALAVAAGKSIKVMDVFSGRQLAATDLPESVTKIFVNADGKQLAVASGKKAWLFDSKTALTQALPERHETISTMYFSADGKLAAVASYGEKEDVSVVDAATGQEREHFKSGSSDAWFSRQGNFLITQPAYAGYPAIDVQDVEKKQGFPQIKLVDSARVLEWSQDGEIFAVGTGERDGSTSVFRTGSWRRLARLKHQGSVPVSAIAVSPNGELAASKANGMTTVFETDEGTALIQARGLGGLKRMIISADGKIVAGVLNRNTVAAFAAGTEQPLARLQDCQIAKARELSLSADGGLLAAGCYNGPAQVLDVMAGKVMAEVAHSNGRPLSISPDGTMVFSVGPQGATIFDSKTGRVIRVIGGDGIIAAAFDHSAKRLIVSSGGGGAEVFETSGDQNPKQFEQNELVESVAFSPDGKHVALGGRSRFVNVYDVDTGERVAALDHKEEERDVFRIRQIVFSTDGKLLASVALDPTQTDEHDDNDATLRVFDIAAETELIRARLTEQHAYIGFSSDHAFLNAAFGDEDIRLEQFPIHPQDLIDKACARMGRNLTEEEWVRYLGKTPYQKTCKELNPAAAEIE